MTTNLFPLHCLAHSQPVNKETFLMPQGIFHAKDSNVLTL